LPQHAHSDRNTENCNSVVLVRLRAQSNRARARLQARITTTFLTTKTGTLPQLPSVQVHSNTRRQRSRNVN